MNNFHNIKCKICGGSNPNLHLEKDGYQIVKCTVCSTVFLNHNADEASLRSFYSAEYFQAGSDSRGYENYEACENFLTVNFQRRIRQLGRFVPSGRVLDIGCGYGFFLKALGPNYAGTGIDVSPHAVSIAREKYGLDARMGPLEKGMFPDGHFSLVTMWDAIEHLSDPKETLKIVHDILQDGGMCVIVTGNVDSLMAKICGRRWHLYTLPEHLWFFSNETLTNLLENNGFRIVKMNNDLCCYSLDYLFERIMKTFLNSSWADQEYPLKSILTKLIIPFSLFDLSYVLCQKQGS